MDGHFVPNITIGPLVVQAVRKATQNPVDVHLMISNPDAYLEAFVDAGADVITVHIETCTHLRRTLTRIRELGAAAGIALNPHTTEDGLRYVLDSVDVVLIMTVNPGFGGQSFLPEVLPKVRAVRSLIDGANRSTLLEVDGGISPSTARTVAAAGARVLVSGSGVFSQPVYEEAVRAIRSEARAAVLEGARA
jgi:ribulose-phosphate 3-epimerase